MGKDLQGKELPRGIMQRPSGVYRGRFKHNGEKYTLENRDLEKLLIEMENLKYEVRHGLTTKGSDMLLDSWFDVWLNTHKSKTIKESTQVRYLDYYERYIKNQLGKRKISDFIPVTIEKLLQDMANKYSTKTIQDTYNILNALFKYAVNNRIIIYNPCQGVEVPKTRRKERRFLSFQEETEILRHAKGRLYEQLIIVALGTGMRSGELRGLTWKDIDFKRQEISVSKTLVYIKDIRSQKYIFKYQEPKTSNGVRKIPMQRNVYNALKQQRIKQKEMQMKAKRWESKEGFENLVFTTSTGGIITEHSFQVCLDGIEKAINKERFENAEKLLIPYEPIKHFYPHAFRHTFATRCFEAGINEKIVQGYLGHYSITITMDLYTHITDEKSKIEMNKLDALYQKTS